MIVYKRPSNRITATGRPLKARIEFPTLCNIAIGSYVLSADKYFINLNLDILS